MGPYNMWTSVDVASTTHNLVGQSITLIKDNLFEPFLFSIGLAVFFMLIGIVFGALRRHGARR